MTAAQEDTRRTIRQYAVGNLALSGASFRKLTQYQGDLHAVPGLRPYPIDGKSVAESLIAWWPYCLEDFGAWFVKQRPDLADEWEAARVLVCINEKPKRRVNAE